MNEQMHSILFTILGRAVDLGQVLTASFVLLFSISLYWFLTRKILPRFIGRGWLKVAPEPSVIRTLLLFFLFVTLLAMLCVMDLDFILFETDTRQVQLYTILEALAIIQFARIADWGMSKIVLYNYEKSRQDETLTGAHQHISTDLKKLDNRSVHYIVYLFALILVLQTFDIDYTLFKFNYIPITISSILVAILIVMVAQVFAWILTQLLYNYYRRQNVNVGSRFAVNQLLKYTIYVIAIFVAIESLGIKMTVVWGGLAALLVGVGLGLQQTFTDLLSGILLLFERTIEVGHVVEIDGMVGTVRRIGLRTSIVETR
ncbi:MAG TPA: mechanosensitive ion channel, partial [Phaeodactylibacter sp.]|nr:mechanosensitive ion channel [Phaeodactylibacter sp.]